MHRTHGVVSRRRAFTMVEMLVVIVIIAILAGLLTGAAIMARGAGRVAVMRTEISQLEMALEQYRNLYGEYPPDFALIAHPDATVANQAQRSVLQHIRKRWPRFQPRDPNTGNPVAFTWINVCNHVLNGTGVDFNLMTPAGALVFWLGGTAENVSDWRPQGFHSDPSNPFKPGLPRERPLFTFKQERIAFAANQPVYLPQERSVPSAPYVYFRARRLPQTMRYEYGYFDSANLLQIARCPLNADPEFGQAVPYLDRWAQWWNGMPAPDQGNDSDYAQMLDGNNQVCDRHWRSEESFQIVSPGLDGSYGIGLDVPAGPGSPSLFRFTKTGARFSQEDYDNLGSFCQGTLEDEIE